VVSRPHRVRAEARQREGERDARGSQHLLNLLEHLPPALFEPLDGRLDAPPQRVDAHPAHLADDALAAALLSEPVDVVRALLALADALERRRDLFRERDLQALVRADLAAALLALVLLLEAARRGRRVSPSPFPRTRLSGASARVAQRGREGLTQACTSRASCGPCAPWGASARAWRTGGRGA